MFTMKPVVFAALLAFVALSSADNEKIFGGREADSGEYEWMGWVEDGRRVGCGAVLIADKYALTAASCDDGNLKTVVFGDHSRSTNETTEQIATVASITPHPDFNSATNENDIAVLEFTEDLDTRRSTGVDTIPLLPQDKLTTRVLNKHCRGAGWGYEVDTTSERARDQSDVLLEIVVDVNQTCTENPTGSVCYSPFRDETSLTCAGDVGGPFMCKRRGVWTLVGIISGWNVHTGCTPGNRAATKVTDVITWVDSIVNINTQSIEI